MKYYELLNTLHEVLNDEKEDLKEETDLQDRIHEIVDGVIPVYTADLLEVALDKLELATAQPDIMAFTGENTAVNAIAGNLYDMLMEEANDWINQNIK